MFYYNEEESRSVTDVGTEILFNMQKAFRAFGRKTKIERIYGKRYNSVGSSTYSEGWRENTEVITGCR